MEEERTKIARWDPMGDPTHLGPFTPLRHLNGARDAVVDGGMHAPVDITETDSHYLVSTRIPGVRSDDIRVESHAGVLRIGGQERTEEGDRSRRRRPKRGSGCLTRSFTLPADADPDRIETHFEDGVLRIRIARRLAAGARAAPARP